MDTAIGHLTPKGPGGGFRCLASEVHIAHPSSARISFLQDEQHRANHADTLKSENACRSDSEKQDVPAPDPRSPDFQFQLTRPTDSSPINH